MSKLDPIFEYLGTGDDPREFLMFSPSLARKIGKGPASYLCDIIGLSTLGPVSNLQLKSSLPYGLWQFHRHIDKLKDLGLIQEIYLSPKEIVEKLKGKNLSEVGIGNMICVWRANVTLLDFKHIIFQYPEKIMEKKL